jgi:hypothetical protein
MDRARGNRTCAREIEYTALPSQQRFHQCEQRFKGFSGPIGSGKSQALCQEAIKLSYLNPGRVGLIGAPTYPMLRDATLNSFLEILISSDIPFEYNKAENILLLQDTRSRILFRAVDDFERLRGTNLAWFGVDELTYCPEESWLRLEGRLRDPKASRLCGYAVWTPKGFDWVYRRFISDPVEGYKAILASPQENYHLLRAIPDFYERLKQSYDERFYEQEVLGAYLNVNSGRCYHAFDRDVNIRKVEWQKAEPLYWALDFNVDPMCSVVAQRSGDEVHVIDEIVISRASTADACAEFRSRFPDGVTKLIIYGDASGNTVQTTGTSDYKIIKSFFKGEAGIATEYKVPSKNPLVRERVNLMNSKLKSTSGDSTLFINPKCKELVKDFEEVTFIAGTTQIDKDRDSKRTHLSDALGYLVWQECRKTPPIGPQCQPLMSI